MHIHQAYIFIPNPIFLNFLFREMKIEKCIPTYHFESKLCMLISFQIWMKFEEINRILLQFYLLRTSSFWGLRPQTPALYFRESKLNQFRVKYRRILWTKKSASIVILFVILFLGAAPPRSLLFISGNQILTNFVSNTDEIYKQINRIPL